MRILTRFLLKLISADRLGYAALQSVLLQLSAVLLNFLTGVITARVLGASGRGVYAAATAWGMLLGSAATVGIADGILIQVRQRPQAARAIVLCGALTALTVASVLSIAAFIAMPLLLGSRDGTVDLARASLLLAHIGVCGVIIRQAHAGQGRYLAANLTAFLPPALYAFVLLGVLAAGKLTVATAIASVGAGAALAYLILLPPLFRTLQGSLSEMGSAWRRLMAFARRAAFADIFALVAGWADRLLLIHLLAPAQLGIYVVAANLAQRITLVSPSTGLLLSAMSAEDPQRAARLHHLALRVTIAAFLPLVALLFLVDRLFMTLVYGAEFAAAVLVFRILVVDTVLGRLAGVTSQLYLVLGRPALNSTIRGLELVVVVATMAALAPRHGEAGAALGLLAGTCVRLVLAWVGLVTHLRVPFPRLWLTRADVVGVKAALD